MLFFLIAEWTPATRISIKYAERGADKGLIYDSY